MNVPLPQHNPAPTPARAPSNVPTSSTTPSTRERVEKVLKLIRPAVHADGGDIELVDITPDGLARIRLHGSCVGCPSSAITLQVALERNLKLHVPEIRGVLAVE